MQKNTRQETYKIVKTCPPKRQGKLNFSINSGVFTCSECEKEFEKPWLLKRHSKVHHISNQMATNTVLDKSEQAELIVKNTILDANAFDYSSDEDDSSSIRDEEDNIVDEKNDIVNNLFDIEMNSNPVFNAFSDMFSSAAAADEVSMTDDDSEIPEEVFETIGTVNYPTSCYPFRDLQAMILFAFINGDNDMISQQMLKKILLAINLIIKIQQETPIGRTFKFSRLDALLNYQARKKFKMPVFPSQRISVSGSNGNVFAHINLPSNHLRFLMANPKKSKLISSMPNHTPNQLICLEQGEKWRTHHLFQQPMHTVNSIDVWFGNIVYLKTNDCSICFLVELFHTANKNIFARGYLVRAISIVCYGVEVTVTDLRVEQISYVDTIPVERDHYYSISSSLTRLSPAHDFLLFGVHPMKKPMPLSVLPGNVDRDAVFYKVRIVSIILFTDNTSGNCLKQYNPFESWLMRCAALPFKDRNSIANIQFLSTIPKKDGANGMSLLPAIVDDFKKLEKGTMSMFWLLLSSFGLRLTCHVIQNFADCLDQPLHFLAEDATEFRCAKDFVKDFSYFCECHERRTQEHYVLANSSSGRDTEIPNAPKIGMNTPANEISFRDHLTDHLLELQLFDPEKDISVEIFHTILLGVVKYMVIDLVKVVLKNDTVTIARLSEFLTDYTVDNAVKYLIRALFDYNKRTKNELHKAYRTKPKVHYLTHLKEDIIRFGPVLNYETEKGEQFNKHIREHLFHMNCQNTSRDVCLKFAKQVALQHVIDGGLWINSSGNREKSGTGIERFIKDNNESLFYYTFFGSSRELKDNNDTGDIEDDAIQNNSFGAFVFKDDLISRPRMGLVSGSVVKFLSIVSCTDNDRNNNYAKAVMTGEHSDVANMNLICKLDLHIFCNPFYIVPIFTQNDNKNLWWYIETLSIVLETIQTGITARHRKDNHPDTKGQKEEKGGEGFEQRYKTLMQCMIAFPRVKQKAIQG
ncbi:C2H2-type zinc finger transcription factor [Phycomyces blakesleeanus NRRL 1555(-)]|uniref:C2H2-type zinc finger transcription factor n=1 Tax=Phycomyces blakesleeanus (strain ATCC 8743b / DSM 1359 / FGSC 10004 / NBRC 33097 / NRRL 1555) TaxID=763407 RepID=A0A162NIK0_PHYB8|nr:C2H2-type zinc finger transcription factor [Phycomyces blakesleeanus NRRL 1555(-)]OAD74568.1 C2H2-type zinc finger transcription factor [Phycomyces blakesleeanus NRRL 1555(-)]|eukprot:XP_018292608.1 C2H2-type zinc finger transcription factor [Phycomyces blakesleeanus NRRL 1555(-)]